MPLTSKFAWPATTTTNSYADLTGGIWHKDDYRAATVVIKNTGGANSATVQVLGSVDGGTNFDITWAADKVLAAGEVGVVRLTGYYNAVKLQSKSTVGGSTTTVEARACGIAV